nr:hypothetical protein BaRGS_002201 [Batillaria attramentaria]
MGYVRVCYYTNWSQFRPAPSRFLAEDINPFLCTHIVFAFANVQGNSIVPIEFNDEEMYGRLVALREANPSLRILLALGGWLAGGTQFSQLVSSEENMIEFANNAIGFLRTFNMDGLDIDWEYPADTERGSIPADRIRFTRLLQNNSIVPIESNK